nr:hypothetical protein [Chlamydia serpentis]
MFSATDIILFASTESELSAWQSPWILHKLAFFFTVENIKLEALEILDTSVVVLSSISGSVILCDITKPSPSLPN